MATPFGGLGGRRIALAFRFGLGIIVVSPLGDGVTGNTPDSGSGERRFESSSPSQCRPAARPAGRPEPEVSGSTRLVWVAQERGLGVGAWNLGFPPLVCRQWRCAPIVQRPRIPGSQPGDRGSNPRGGASECGVGRLPASHGSSAHSSIGQSRGLRSRRLEVRVLLGAPRLEARREASRFSPSSCAGGLRHRGVGGAARLGER